MKRVFVAAAVAATVSSGAFAADIVRGPAPYAPLPAYYNWSGAYAGLNLGYQWGEITHLGGNPSGVLGGAQVGYNWQSGAFVFGGETDIQITGASDTFAPYKFSNPWFGTLRARAGYAMNNILVYGTLGLAYGDLNITSAGFDETHTLAGWTGGVGMEVGFTPRWSAKAEYLYMDLSDRAFAITGATNGLQSNILRFGINYHF